MLLTCKRTGWQDAWVAQGDRDSKLRAKELQPKAGRGKVCNQLCLLALWYLLPVDSLFCEASSTKKKTLLLEVDRSNSHESKNARSRLVPETMPRKKERKRERKKRGDQKRNACPIGPSPAQPKEGRIQGEETKRAEPRTTSFSTIYTQQTSPYSLTKLQKELLNPFFCS